MADRFNFYGQTTFINQPVNTVISDFQKTYIENAAGEAASVLEELKTLVQLLLRSEELEPSKKEEAVRAAHELAEEISRPEAAKPALEERQARLKQLLSGVADVAGPAARIIAAISRFIALF